MSQRASQPHTPLLSHICIMQDGTAQFKEAHGDSATPRKKLLRMEVANVPAEVLAAKFGGAAAKEVGEHQVGEHDGGVIDLLG